LPKAKIGFNFMLVGTFIDWKAEDTSAMIGYIKDLITDLTPLLIPIIAIGLGLIIVSVIVGVIRKH